MKTLIRTWLFTLVLLTTGLNPLRAERPLPPDVQRLSDAAYRYYSSRQTDRFFATVKQVKQATEEKGFDKTYY